jgi:cephalosporin-C deacetylase
MPLFELPLEELHRHRIASTAPPDLDQFWQRALSRAEELAREPVFEPYRRDVYGDLAVDDVAFSGADGDVIRGWFIRPAAATGRLPCLVHFVGYGGGRGFPSDHALYPSVGYALFVMDTRGQGGRWSPGATGDPSAGASGPEHPGVMTRGVGDPETYYYRRLYVDAVRAVEVARTHPQVDADRVAVVGGSQGGGLALAAAALAPDRVRRCHADMPFLCDMERAVTLGLEHPYLELAMRTLSYFDCGHLRHGYARTVSSVSVYSMPSVRPQPCSLPITRYKHQRKSLCTNSASMRSRRNNTSCVSNISPGKCADHDRV